MTKKIKSAFTHGVFTGGGFKRSDLVIMAGNRPVVDPFSKYDIAALRASVKDRIANRAPSSAETDTQKAEAILESLQVTQLLPPDFNYGAIMDEELKHFLPTTDPVIKELLNMSNIKFINPFSVERINPPSLRYDIFSFYSPSPDYEENYHKRSVLTSTQQSLAAKQKQRPSSLINNLVKKATQ